MRDNLSTAATALFGKRDVGSANQQLNITEQRIEFEQNIDWDKILRRDPFNCALSLICQLSAGAAKDNEEANRIYEFITWVQKSNSVSAFIKKFFTGTQLNTPKCRRSWKNLTSKVRTTTETRKRISKSATKIIQCVCTQLKRCWNS